MPLRSSMLFRVAHVVWLALALNLVACARASAPVPEAPPTIQGTIMALEGEQYLVMADSARPRRVRSPRVFVSVGPGVRLLWRDGRPAALSDLSVGRYVSVWTTGIVLESRPPQVNATVSIVERPE